MVTKVAKTTGRASKSATSRLMSNLTNSLPSSFPNCFLPFVDHEKKGSIHSNTLIEYFLSINDALKTSCKTGFRFWNSITEEFWDMRGRYDQQQIDSFLYRFHGIDARGQILDQKKNALKKTITEKKAAKDEAKDEMKLDGDLKEVWANKTKKRTKFVPSLDVKTHSHYCVLQEELARFNCWRLPPSVGNYFRRNVCVRTSYVLVLIHVYLASYFFDEDHPITQRMEYCWICYLERNTKTDVLWNTGGIASKKVEVKEGNRLFIDGRKGLLLKNWLIMFPVQKYSVNSGVGTCGFVKVLYSQVHLVANRCVKIDKIYKSKDYIGRQKNNKKDTPTMPRDNHGVAKAIFIDCLPTGLWQWDD